MVFTLSKRKQGREILDISKKRRCSTVNSHVNSSKPNNSNTSNRDNVIGNSNPPRIEIQYKVTLIHSLLYKQKLMQSQVLVSIIK